MCNDRMVIWVAMLLSARECLTLHGGQVRCMSADFGAVRKRVLNAASGDGARCGDPVLLASREDRRCDKRSTPPHRCSTYGLAKCFKARLSCTHLYR